MTYIHHDCFVSESLSTVISISVAGAGIYTVYHGPTGPASSAVAASRVNAIYGRRTAAVSADCGANRLTHISTNASTMTSLPLALDV